jgi:hypothetical protein
MGFYTEKHLNVIGTAAQVERMPMLRHSIGDFYLEHPAWPDFFAYGNGNSVERENEHELLISALVASIDPHTS